MIKKYFFLLFPIFFTLSFGQEIYNDIQIPNSKFRIQNSNKGQAISDRVNGWCGTLEALRLFQEGKALQRPQLSGPEEYIERANLRVHFTRSGADACDSSYAIRVANYTEYSWHKQIDTLSWASPPPDYGIGGDDRYDLYIAVQPAGIAGMTVSEMNYPDPYPEGVTSYIAIDNQLSDDFLKVVCAHEFSHACQMRYSRQEMGFVYENTSVWMEDVCYDEINDYVGYLSSTPNPLANPDYPITSTENLYLYAGGIWFIFLDEYYDRNCPRQSWEKMGEVAGRNTLNAIDEVLRNYYSSTLRDALKNYGLWRYFVGAYADTVNYFSEGNLWPVVRVLRTHNDYPCQGNQDPYPPSSRGGASYIRLQNGAGKLGISFDGQAGYDWRLWVVGYQPGNSQAFELALDSASAQGSDSFDWRDYQHCAIIPVVCQWEWLTNGLTFNYNANCRIEKDVGVQSIVGVPSSADTGAVIFPKAWIKNYGINPETFPATFRIGERYTDMQMITLAPGDSTFHEFAPCTLLERGSNSYACTLALNGDERLSNNSRNGTILVWVKDVGVISILEPVGTIGLGQVVTPRARIKNFGNYPILFNVIFWIGDWNTTKRISLGAGSQNDITFDSTWLASDTGEYATKCSTAYAQDMNKSNDKVEDHFFVGPPGIEELNHSFPLSAEAKIEIYNALGMKIKNTNNNLKSLSLAPGVYFLNIREGEKEFKRKILIIR